MIKCLMLNNFQSHKFSELELSEGVNIITGTSNSGKTSVVRAISWVMNNRPRGDGIIRKGESDSFVTIILQKVGLTRKRDKKFNGYEVDCFGKDNSIKLEALGGDIPEEVSEALNLSDINLQEQFSPYFLVMDSPGKVGQYINSVTKLSELDDIIAVIGSKIRNTTGKRDILKAELDNIDIGLDELKKYDLDLLEKKINEYHKWVEVDAKLCIDIKTLSSLGKELEEIEGALEHLFPDVSELLTKALVLSSDYMAMNIRTNSLTSDVEQYKEVVSALSILTPDVSEQLSEANKLYLVYEKLDNNIVKVKEEIRTWDSVTSELNNLQKELGMLEGEEEKVMSELTVCPSCGQDMDKTAKAYFLRK